MNYSWKINKNILYVGTTILMLVFVFAFMAIVSPAQAAKSVSEAAISHYLTAQVNPALGNEEKIKAAIDAYFTTRYEGQKTLDAQDYSILVSAKTVAQEWLHKEKDKQEIEIFQGKTFDLKYLDYKYTLNYENIEISGNTASVLLFENNEVIYSLSAPTVTRLANLRHALSLEFEDNIWKITNDDYRDELSQLMRDNSKLKIKQDIQNAHDAKIESSYFGKAGLAMPSLATYNRTNAVNYAQSWWSYPGKSNDYLPMYTTIGYSGDCTNYASQVIKAGGGVLDNSGTKKWFYSEGSIGDNFNNWSTYSDDTWSNSWSLVDNLYNYLVDNTTDTPGPKGTVYSLSSLCNMAGGDVIQLSSNGGSSYFHMVVVVSVGGGCTSDGHSVLVNSHDTDRQNYPLISYSAYTKRLLGISQP